MRLVRTSISVRYGIIWIRKFYWPDYISRTRFMTIKSIRKNDIHAKIKKTMNVNIMIASDCEGKLELMGDKVLPD